MGTKVNIMDLDVDIISIDYLILNCKGFLTNDCLNIIYLISAKALQETIQNEQYKEAIEVADFVLPGEKSLLSKHHVDTLQTEGMIVDYHFLYPLFENISEEPMTVFLIGRNAKEIEKFIEFSNRMYPNLKIVGTCTKELLEKEEILINEINTFTPDILIFAIDSPLQEQWISGNKLKLNSKLCLGIGGVIDEILSDSKVVPQWIKNLGLQKVYQFLFQNKGMRKLGKTRIFMKKIENYNNKKGEKNNGNIEQ